MAQIKNVSGNTYINKNMLVSIVSLATKEIEGVVDVYQPKRLTMRGLFDKNIGKGVRIKHTKFGMIIDIYVIADVYCVVSELVYKIQQNVKNNIASLVPLDIKAVNVHIRDAEKLLSA